MKLSRLVKSVSLLIALSFGLISCDSAEKPTLEKRIRPVRVSDARLSDGEILRKFAGSSQAALSSVLSFRTGGAIIEFPAKVGMRVDSGTLIAGLNDTDLKIKVQTDEAAFRKASLLAENYKSQFLRVQNLYKRQLLSLVEFENAQTNYEQALAQKDQAKGALDFSKQQLAYSRLESPADGCVVSDVHSALNENISAGQPIVTMNCGNIIEVEVTIPESVISSVQALDSVTVQFASLGERKFSGTVSEISNSATNAGYPVTVQLDNQERLLRPGMAAEVGFQFSFSKISNNVWVPLVAIGKDDSGTFVYVYESSADGDSGLVHKREVKTGVFTVNEVEIISGLKPGEKVITAGLSQIYEGLEVRLLDKEQ